VAMLLPWVYVPLYHAIAIAMYLPYLDGKSSDARGALELLPSEPGLVRSLVHRRTGCIACDKQQAYALLLLEQEKKISGLLVRSTITNTPLSRKRVSRTQRRSLWEA
jgi:hypothetical protein